MEQELQRAGLTGNEAKVYLELLRRGSISANDLAKHISMDRTLAYTVLNHLIEKGLVHYVIKSNKKFFEAADPKNLLNPIKENEAFVSDLIPKLQSIEKLKETKQEVNVYEGKEGLRSFMQLLMKHKSFCAFGATGRAYDALYELPRVAKEAQKSGLTARIITSSRGQKHEMIQLKNIKFRHLDVEGDATTTIFGDNIALHRATEKPLIIVISNAQIAKSYKNHFEILWSVAKD